MRKHLARLWPYLAKYRSGWIFGLSSLVLKDVTAASLPLVIRAAIDALTACRPMRTVVGFALLLIAICGAKGFFQYWMRWILVGISRDIEYDIRNDLFAHLTRLSPGYFARNRTGDLMARSTNDLNAVRMMLGPGVMYWCETTLTFILAIGVMSWMDWRLMILAIIPAPSGEHHCHRLWPPHSRALPGNPGHVLRYQQSRAGDSRGCAYGSRLRPRG